VQEEYKKRNLLNELYMAQKDEMHKCCEQQSYKKNYPYWNEMPINVKIITFTGHMILKKNKRME